MGPSLRHVVPAGLQHAGITWKVVEMPLPGPFQGCSEMPAFKDDALSDFHVHIHIKGLRIEDIFLGPRTRDSDC